MQSLKLITILLFLLAFKSHSSSTLVKENSYGKLISYPDEGRLIFNGSYGKINIEKNAQSLKYTFYDGSYVYIDLSKNLLKRYSAKSRRTESFTFQRYPTTLWNVNSRVKSSFTQFENFNNYPDMKDMDPDPCDNSSGPCDYHPLNADLEISLTNDMESRFSTASSACSKERSKFLNRGFNGHSSLERCRLGSTIDVAISGVTVVAACVFEPTKAGCFFAVGNYARSLVMYGDSTLACYDSYNSAHEALESCEASNGGGSSPGSGGSDGNSGGAGGTGGGTGGGGGFQRECYTVITGGGVTSWCDYKPV